MARTKISPLTPKNKQDPEQTQQDSEQTIDSQKTAQADITRKILDGIDKTEDQKTKTETVVVDDPSDPRLSNVNPTELKVNVNEDLVYNKQCEIKRESPELNPEVADDLISKVRFLTSENEELTRRLNTLTMENFQLKNTISEFQKQVNQLRTQKIFKNKYSSVKQEGYKSWN